MSAKLLRDALQTRPKIFTCRCCGKLTIEERDDHEICEVCGWEDDQYQNEHPERGGGANVVSLNEAPRNVAEFGTSDPEQPWPPKEG